MSKFIEMSAAVLMQSAGQLGETPKTEKTGDDHNTGKGRESDGFGT